MSEDTRPNLARVLTQAIARAGESIRVALPAKVVAYDASIQAVDVQPMIKDRFENEDGDIESETLPVIPRVPVVFPGANGFRVTFPIAVGDTVLLVFSDRSLDVWLDQGRVVDPNDPRTHSLADAIAIPGLRSYKSPLLDAPTDAMSIGSDTSGAVIEIDDSEIRAGGTEKLSLRDELNDLRDFVYDHVHPTPSGASSAATGRSAISSDYPGTQILKGG